jgi:L-iditol 2-dehydrogenase
MRAAVLHGPQQVCMEERPIPEIGASEVLVKIAVATTCATDLKVFQQGGHARMITVPSIFGHEFSGTIVAVGRRVRGVEEGMRVVANNSAPCHHCYYCRRHLANLCEDLLFLNGAYAEYIAVPERIVQTNLLPIPDAMSHAAACLTEPLACVLHCLEKAVFHPGDTVVVNGDGASGLMLAATAAWRGARVILCGRTPQRLQIAQYCGVQEVINYAAVPDQVAAVRAITNGGRGVDVAIEAVGRPEVWEATVRMVRKGGQAIFYGGCRRDTTVCLDTYSLHYDQLTLQGVFHNTPRHVHQAVACLAQQVVPADMLISTTLPLTSLPQAFDLMTTRQALKVALVPCS